MVPRSSALLAISVIVLVGANSAAAGSTDRNGHHHHRRHDNAGIASPAGLPSVIPGLGTFAGDISAVRIRGVGNYFMIQTGSGNTDGVILAPKARIIEVEGNDACSYEAGVCVVRP